MERFTFQDPNVAKLLESFTLLRVDVTHNTSNDQALLKKRLIFGAPSIVFYSPQGQEIQGTRLVGFQSADSFSKHLERILALNS
jgi:thiol:disulfide interchange protein DsbD